MKSEMKETVSVIVPIYNAEKTIERCIESIVHQVYQYWKLILVDDGSTDGTAKILDSWAEKNQRFQVIHKGNAGVSSARNTGLDHADTDYVVFVDSDDWVEADYLQKLISAAEENADSGHIWCGFYAINESGNERKYILSGDQYSYFDRKDFMYLHEQWMTQMPWHRLFNNSIIKEYHLRFDENLSLGEDLLFNMQYMDCVNQTRIVVVNKPLYNYVVAGTDSLNSKYRNNLLSIYERINTYVGEYLHKWDTSVEGWEMYYNMVFFNYEKAMFNCFSAKNTTPFAEKVAFNNEILRKNEFIDAFSRFTGYIHPLYRISYKLKDYRFALIVTYLVKIKNKLMRNG